MLSKLKFRVKRKRIQKEKPLLATSRVNGAEQRLRIKLAQVKE